MTKTYRINNIYTSITAPGAGKTENLLAKLPNLIAAGKRIVLALPTLALIDEIAERARSKGADCTPIDHRAGEIVVPNLERALSDELTSLVVCTQDSIRQVQHHLLSKWTLVLDELPKVVDYPDYLLNELELGRVLEYTEEREGQLWISDGMEHIVREQVITHNKDARGIGCSTLGKSAANIFRLLLSQVPVFIDKEIEIGKRHVRAVEEFTAWWDLFSAASETHVLAASVSGSEFEVFARAHGYRLIQSAFTPKPCPLNSAVVTIYPVIPKDRMFSKSLMLTPEGDKNLIDEILAKIKLAAGTTPLLFANKWARYKHAPGVRYVDKDCRGLNAYSDATEAAVLFGGNPSPSESRGLEYLALKYGCDFKQAFITTRLLEPSLQAATRTAVRCRDNTAPIKLFVQDYRVTDYLLATYFPDATVNWSFAETSPMKQDGRKLDKSVEAEVNKMISDGITAVEINKVTGVSRKKIQAMKKTMLAA